MKKGFIALLVTLAVVVLVSPGIIGRFAEQGLDQNLAWAASEQGEIVVTPLQFDSGWFTSSGQHRVELLRGDLYDALLLAFGSTASTALPALLLDTHLDHGLVPVTSLQRENGSLLPGLGSAVSTLRLAFADGSVVPLPGKLFSNIGLDGSLESRFILEPDGANGSASRIDWGRAEFLLTTDRNAGRVALDGTLNSVAVEADHETTIVGKFAVNFALADSGFGFMVGPTRITLDSFAVIGADETMAAGPMYLQADSSVDAGRLAANLTMRLENLPVPLGGSGGIDFVARLENVDAAALGQLKLSLAAARSSGFDPQAAANVLRDLKRLLAGGLQLHFDRLDVSSPLGQATSDLKASVSRSDASDYSWATALMALDATAHLKLPAALVDLATEQNPDMLAVIGMGFLRKEGQFYTIEAAFRQGLLTVNGAPLPIPLSGLQ